MRIHLVWFPIRSAHSGKGESAILFPVFLSVCDFFPLSICIISHYKPSLGAQCVDNDCVCCTQWVPPYNIRPTSSSSNIHKQHRCCCFHGIAALTNQLHKKTGKQTLAALPMMPLGIIDYNHTLRTHVL